MKLKTGKWFQFLDKMRFQYRISIMNENTLEESWFVRLSRFSVFLYASILIFVTFLILTLIIFFTPIRYYLPGYSNLDNRESVINESMIADSLVNQVKSQTAYMDMISAVIAGTVKPGEVASLDTIALKQREELLMEKRKTEKEYVDQFEEEEKFNLASIDSKQNENIYVFFRPTKGVISSGFDLQEKQYGISILTSTHEPVFSVLTGTVIYTGYTFENGWVVQVQHDNNYISVYKNNTSVLKKAGDQVKAGEAIAFTGDSNSKTNSHFYFELWKQGKPVNPEELIVF